MAPLANVVEDLGKLGNDLTERDHIIVVEGPGQETAWIEITITQWKWTSASLQIGPIT
jgi:hypothetical protein